MFLGAFWDKLNCAFLIIFISLPASFLFIKFSIYSLFMSLLPIWKSQGCHKVVTLLHGCHKVVTTLARLLQACKFTARLLQPCYNLVMFMARLLQPCKL